MARRAVQERSLQQNCVTWGWLLCSPPAQMGFLPALPLQTTGVVVLLQVARSLGSAFFSPPSSKCFICLTLLNHSHICTNDTRNSSPGFPHQLPALNIKYSGPCTHACHLHGCLDSSHQWEQGRLPFVCFLYRITKQFQRCSLQGKNTFKTR